MKDKHSFKYSRAETLKSQPDWSKRVTWFSDHVTQLASKYGSERERRDKSGVLRPSRHNDRPVSLLWVGTSNQRRKNMVLLSVLSLTVGLLAVLSEVRFCSSTLRKKVTKVRKNAEPNC